MWEHNVHPYCVIRAGIAARFIHSPYLGEQKPLDYHPSIHLSIHPSSDTLTCDQALNRPINLPAYSWPGTLSIHNQTYLFSAGHFIHPLSILIFLARNSFHPLSNLLLPARQFIHSLSHLLIPYLALYPSITQPAFLCSTLYYPLSN